MKKIIITVIFLALAFGAYYFYSQLTEEQRCIDDNGYWNEQEKTCIKREGMSTEELKELEDSYKEQIEKEIEYCNTHDFEQDKGEDGRIIVSRDNAYCFSREIECNVSFNYDKPDIWETYQGHGIKINLPYNLKWGNDKYSILPWDERENMISFGPITTFEACTWLRVDNIEFLEKKSKEEVIEELNNLDYIVSKPEVIERNGFEVIKYSLAGICGGDPMYIVIGEEYNYRFFASVCTEEKGAYEYYDKLIDQLEIAQ